ncbi:MAG: class I adenylate-forming enzyme family protein, partial [Woeseia sp.]
MNWFEAATPLLPDIIRNNADHRGSLPAVICGEQVLNWRDFDRELNRVANALSDLDLVPGDRVALLMNNSVDMLIIMLGAISGGFVAVPLNVSVSDDGICRQINDSGASAVVASSGYDERIDGMRKRLPPSIGDRWLAVPSNRSGWKNLRVLCSLASDRRAAVKIDPQQACNVIYSSGTTGLPKGIVHSHACRMAWAYDMAVALRYHSDARTLISLGLYSNITWVTMLATLLAG